MRLNVCLLRERQGRAPARLESVAGGLSVCRHWVDLRTFCQPLTLRYSALRRRAQRDNRPRPALKRRHRTVPPARAVSCVAQALLVSSSPVARREVTCSKRRCLRRWRQRLCSRGCSFMPLGHGRPVPCSLAREELIRDGRRHRLSVCVLVLRKDTLYHYSVLNSTMAFSRRPCTTQLPLGPGHPPISISIGGCSPPHICKQQGRGPPAWPKVAEGTSVWWDHVGRVGVARRRSSDSRES